MPDPLKRAGEILDVAEAAFGLFQRFSDMTDRVVSIGELRFRAEVCRRKARNSKRQFMRDFWAARARGLDVRADRIEAKR
jgi:hypothetical protein